MSEEGEQQRSARSGRLKWTELMNVDLMECKIKAKELVASNNPPLKVDGRKKGYMQLMKELWNDKGYAGLNLSCQNLRDQAAKVEKSLGDVSEVIMNNVGRRETELYETNELTVDSEDQFIFGCETINSQCEQSTPSNLHTSANIQSQEDPADVLINTQIKTILEIACPLYESVAAIPGDFSARTVDTRTKERPTLADIENINKASSELMRQKSTGIPRESGDPFIILWSLNCVLYSVVVAFLLQKGWKKDQVKGKKTERDQRIKIRKK